MLELIEIVNKFVACPFSLFYFDDSIYKAEHNDRKCK